MAYGPMNARSELVMPANFSGGGVFETTRRFHVASPAFMSPARRPTRGSGLGATVDMFAPPDDAHAAREHTPMVSPKDLASLMASVSVTGRWSGTGARRASSASGRFRSSDRRTHRRRTGRPSLALPRPARTAR